jgi:hypothetical protein
MEILSTNPVSGELMECVVTLKSLELLESFYNDMETPGGDLYIPDRQVPVYMRRPLSVNTHYMLSIEEINSLRLDPRVVAVNPAKLIRQSKKLTGVRTGVTDNGSLYDKRNYIQPIDKLSTNWALLRCTLGTQLANWGDENPAEGVVGTVGYTGSQGSASSYAALSFTGPGPGLKSQFLKLPASSNFAVGNQNWCIECWFRQTVTRTSYAQIIGMRSTNWEYCPIAIGTTSGKLTVSSSRTGSGWDIAGTNLSGGDGPSGVVTSIDNNRWYHVAAVRNGECLDVYVDGTSVWRKYIGAITYTQTLVPFCIGGADYLASPTGGGDPFIGQITNVRVTKGNPVYTVNFAVPTTPLNAVTGTVLLIKDSITDLASGAAITNRNNVTLLTVSPGPFSPSIITTLDPANPVLIEPTGQNVDVIIVDGMCGVPNHPEFAHVHDGTGGSRYVQFEWHSLNTVASSLDDDSATLLTGSYSYAKATNASNANHGAHTAGTVAGNSQGWAVNANIYQIDPVSNTIDPLIIWDYIRAFHKTKPINPATGLRNPTICNCSYGSTLTHNNPPNPDGIGPIVQGTWRGGRIGTYSQNIPLTHAQLTNLGIYSNPANPDGTATIPILWSDEEADIRQAIADGIIVVGAAGNESQYIDKLGGSDYNNSYYFRYTGGASPVAVQFNYNRGFAPGAVQGAICVGAVDANKSERKAYYSNTGPRIDVFAPGTWIMSSVADGVGEGFGTIQDPRSNSYYIGKSIGTSMATPQVTGVLACVLQKYPRMSPAKALQYINYYSKTGQLFSPTVGTSPSWVADQYHLLGANNRYLFMPNERPLTGMAYPKKNYWVRINNGSTSTVITPPGSLVFNEFQANVNALSITQNYLTVTGSPGIIPKFHNVASGSNDWTVESWVNCFNDGGQPRTLLSTCGNISGIGVNISVGSAGVVVIDFYNGVGNVGNVTINDNKKLRITTDPSTIPSGRLPGIRQWFHLLITAMRYSDRLLVRSWINGVEISAVWEIFNSSNTRIAGPLTTTGGIPMTGNNNVNLNTLWYNGNQNEATYPLAIGREQGVPGPSKLYFEFSSVQPFGVGFSSGRIGIQRTPTRVGPYKEPGGGGVMDSGNGGVGVLCPADLDDLLNTYGVLIDPINQTVTWTSYNANGNFPRTDKIPGSGPMYFACYDYSITGQSRIRINWGNSGFAFSMPIPAGAVSMPNLSHSTTLSGGTAGPNTGFTVSDISPVTFVATTGSAVSSVLFPIPITTTGTASIEFGYFSGLITNLAIYDGPKIGFGLDRAIEVNFTPNFPIDNQSSLFSVLRTLLLVNNDTTKFNIDQVGQQTIVNCSGGANGLTANVTPVTFRATSPAGSTIVVPGAAGSLLFNRDRMLNFNSNQSFNLGSGSFTLEAWIYTGLAQTTTIMGCQVGPSPGRGWLFGLQPDSQTNGMLLNFGWTATGQIWTATKNFYVSNSFAVPSNRWTHVAFVKITVGGGVVDRYAFYVNGNMAGSGPMTGTIKYHGTFGIGGTPNESTSGQSYFNGYMNNIRVTRAALYGYLYTALPLNFIPEKRLVDLEQTVLLLQVNSDSSKYTNSAAPLPGNTVPVVNNNFTNFGGSSVTRGTGPAYSGAGSNASEVLPIIQSRTVTIPPTGESGRIYPRPKKYVRV